MILTHYVYFRQISHHEPRLITMNLNLPTTLCSQSLFLSPLCGNSLFFSYTFLVWLTWEREKRELKVVGPQFLGSFHGCEETIKRQKREIWLKWLWLIIMWVKVI